MHKTKEIFVGSRCENNCIFCKFRDEQRADRSFLKIKSELDAAKNTGIERVIFTGGNPLLHASFNELLDYAHSLCFRCIGVATNGRAFYKAKMMQLHGRGVCFDDSMKKIIERLNYFKITVCGADAAMHDSITRSTGSFDETINGMENINSVFASAGVQECFIQADVPVLRENFSSSPEIVEMVSKIHAARIRLLLHKGVSADSAIIKKAVEAGIGNGVWIEIKRVAK